VVRPVVCSEPLVESTGVEAKQGVVIPLVNWSDRPVTGLTVTVVIDVRNRQTALASGRQVRVVTRAAGACSYWTWTSRTP
jgi:hypothetical protein